MIKKLYSSRKTSKAERNEKKQENSDLGLVERQNKNLLEDIFDREVFGYTCWSRFAATSFCAEKCCCRKKDRKDRLFLNAEKRLTRELDVVKILKTLRIAKMVG